MKVSALAEKLSLKIFCLPQPESDISGGYVGDLLSWVMGRAQYGDAWVTIMSNRNVAAVAQLTECACVILAEDVVPDADLQNLAQEHGINLLGSGLSAFRLCEEIAACLRG